MAAGFVRSWYQSTLAMRLHAIPALGDEDVRLRALAGPVAQPVAVLPEHLVVGGGVGVDLEGQAAA